MLTRLYRRIIIRRFGGLRNSLLWLLAVVLTIYVLDNYVFPKQSMRFTQDDKQSSAPPAAASNKDQVPVKYKPEEKPFVAAPPVKVEEGKPEVVADVKQPAAAPAAPAAAPADPAAAKPVKSQRKGSACLSDCPAGQVSYYIKSGKDRDISPVMCIDGNYVMSDKKNPGKRGLNVVVIDNETFTVQDNRTFDVYENDALMVRYLKLGVQEGHYILVATLDEASYHLTDEGRNVLKRYGSSLVAKLGFRDNFIMLGQRGLAEGSAVEKHVPRKEGAEFSDTVEMSGCVDIPIGKITPYIISDDEKNALAGGPRVGLDKTDCGVPSPCDENSFSVQLFTGIENKYMAKMCVNGKYVYGEGLNDAGRGLNIAVVNPATKDVVRVGRFDTFGADSSNLEIFIEMLSEGEIVLLVTYDEASKNFDLTAQKLFQSLGSSYADKLSFRDSWVFVGQQGMTGYSPIEELSPANGGWPKPIDKILCVPTKLTGSNLPQPEPPRNKPAS